MADQTTLISRLKENPSLVELIQRIEKHPSLLIDEMKEGGSKAALIALIAEMTGKNLLILSGSSADRLQGDLSTLTSLPVFEFPSWETLPGEGIAPSLDLIGKRLETLYNLLNQSKPYLLVAPLQAALQKIPRPTSLKSQIHQWKKGDSLAFNSLPELLSKLGYRKASLVADKGEFAIRGGILDLFPLSSTDPYRLEFFGDTLEEIRSFDPISQKSIEKIPSFLLPPAFETTEAGESILFDYMSKNTIVIFNNLLEIEDHWVALQKRIEDNPSQLLSFSEFFAKATSLSHLFLCPERLEELSSVQRNTKGGRAFYSGKTPVQPLQFEFAHQKIETQRSSHPFFSIPDVFSLSDNEAANSREELIHSLTSSSKKHIELHLLYATEAEELSFLSQNPSLPSQSHHHRGYLSSGFFIEDEQLCLFPMTELTHRLQPRRQKWRSTHHTPSSDFHELSVNDTVVHYHHGIAKYRGIEKKTDHKGVMGEFLILEYAEKSTLFVPVSQSHLVSRYIGTKEEIPTLSQLGSNKWLKTRSLAQTAITGYASDLIRLYAEREVIGGHLFAPDSKTMLLFEEDFPFSPTEDQVMAIEEIKKEMQSAKAMDRLICGDVGYGKTEVAMRAAFKAVIDGKKQVAVLVPTTVLAMQHSETFAQRMSNFSIRVKCLSRFQSAKENKQTLSDLKDGQVDILIGTHRLLSQDVQFKDLGLLIIDEEQRFGVRAKEHLRKLKKGVDTISLSATPIPRTLYLSLIGARSISTINTPPQDRLPIKSIISTKDSALIKSALLRELSRDGQAYFIHNRVETIFKVADELQALLPEARIVVGHGQMSADELDTVFHAFKQGEADILVATTIIENGIDIPNANTILIDRADTFGLADLYQMRGRVGRWNRPAFAYFLIPQFKELPELTRKRLHAISESSGFGGGMKIAMRDLEIRGAGDILGVQQSGQVSSIGFHLYCKLLKKAIEAMRSGKSPSFMEAKMEFSFPASLPEEYINEPTLRMEIYHRLGEATSLQEVNAILSELKDRFGPCPLPVLWLYHMTLLRLFASQHHFIHIRFDPLTLTAERQSKNGTTKKLLALKRTDKPEEMRKQVESLLTEAFNL